MCERTKSDLADPSSSFDAELKYSDQSPERAATPLLCRVSAQLKWPSGMFSNNSHETEIPPPPDSAEPPACMEPTAAQQIAVTAPSQRHDDRRGREAAISFLLGGVIRPRRVHEEITLPHTRDRRAAANVIPLSVSLSSCTRDDVTALIAVAIAPSRCVPVAARNWQSANAGSKATCLARATR